MKSPKNRTKVIAKYEKGEVTLARIREAVIAEITERGYHKTNVCEIVKRAKLTRGAFYNYWDSLDDCIIDTLNHLETVDHAAGESSSSGGKIIHISKTVENMQLLMTKAVKKKWKAGYLLLSLIQEKDITSKDLHKRIKLSFSNVLKYWQDLIEEDKKNKIISEHVPSESAAMAVMSMIGSILHLSVSKIDEYQHLQEKSLIYFINSILNDSARKKMPVTSIYRE